MLKKIILTSVICLSASSSFAEEQKSYTGNSRLLADNSLRVGKIKSSQVGGLTRRRNSFNLMGYGFGPYSSSNLGTDALMYGLSITNHREVSEYGELRLRGGFQISEDGKASSGTLTVGGAFLPFTGDVTPLLGGEFGFGAARGKDVKTKAGFAWAGIIGMRFFRTSSSHLEIAGRYESVLKKNEKGSPASYGLQVSLLL